MKEVSLREVMALTCQPGLDDELMYLEVHGRGDTPQNMILTVRQVKETFDLRRTMVTRISPKFICGDYEGVNYTIRPGSKRTERRKRKWQKTYRESR